MIRFGSLLVFGITFALAGAMAAAQTSSNTDHLVQDIKTANGRAITPDNNSDPALKLTSSWDGNICTSTLINTGDKPVRIAEVVLLDLPHHLPEETSILGEGLTMLSLTTGTLGKPTDVDHYTDRGHYRLAEPESLRTVYGMLLMQPAASEHLLLGFTSCNRFVGRISFNATRLRVSLDTENLSLAPGQRWELEPLLVARSTSRSAALSHLCDEIAKHHPPTFHTPVPTGWCSWYCFGPGGKAGNILDNLNGITGNFPALRNTQIDDGYQPWMGDWLEPGKAFGGGLKMVLKEIQTQNLQPAIWVAPFIASPQSQLFHDHPDWFIQDDAGQPLRSDKLSVAVFLAAVNLIFPIEIHGQATVDPRGPVTYPSMRVIAAPGDVEAQGYQFNPQTAKPGPWKGQWIGSKQSPAAPLLVRRVFELPEIPARVRAWISADPYARVYVNGQLVSRDPDDIGRDFNGSEWTRHWFYEYRDLTPFFHAGKNVVAAEVIRNVPMLGMGPSAFLFEASVDESGATPIMMASDNTWKVVPAAQFRSVSLLGDDPKAKPRSVAVNDESLEPPGWRESGFDDSAWPAAVISIADRGVLTASEIPPCMETVYPGASCERPTDGVSLPKLPGQSIKIVKNGSFAVHYDRVLSAYFGFHARGPAGTIITLSASERGGPGGTGRLGNVVLGEGTTFYDSPFIDSFSTVNVTVSNVTGPVEIEDLRAVFTSQPVSYRGSFACSDPNLTKLWTSLRWSLQLCLQTHHLDSPNHYEPLCDPGDYLVESVANDYTFDMPWLARQDLKKYAWLLDQKHYRPFHTSYALMWLQMLGEYYRYTGDAELPRLLAPYVHHLLDEFATYRGANGLLCNAPDFMFMDWVTVDGFNLHHPPAVIGQGYITALFYRALQDGILVSELTGDAGHAAKYRATRAEIAAAYEHELWSADAGLYRDGRPGQSKMTRQNDRKWVTEAELHRWLPADKPIETFTPQNNSLAILYGLAPHDRAAAIADRLFSGDLSKLNMQPYFWFFALPAMERAGRFEEYALPLMRELQINPVTQTVSEMMHSGDLSHAWVSAPLVNLSASVLGVTPKTPGYATISIHPLPSGLDWASGVVPTPHGDVSVAWSIENHVFSIDLVIPNGTTADFMPPPGYAVEGDPSGDLPAGRHHFICRVRK